jgi:hypothetical protein
VIAAYPMRRPHLIGGCLVIFSSILFILSVASFISSIVFCSLGDSCGSGCGNFGGKYTSPADGGSDGTPGGGSPSRGQEQRRTRSFDQQGQKPCSFVQGQFSFSSRRRPRPAPPRVCTQSAAVRKSPCALPIANQTRLSVGPAPLRFKSRDAIENSIPIGLKLRPQR